MANHPAEHGIYFDVIMAAAVPSNEGQFRPFNLLASAGMPGPAKRVETIAKPTSPATFIFGWILLLMFWGEWLFKGLLDD